MVRIAAMKRVSGCLAAGVLAACLVGCGSGSDSGSAPKGVAQKYVDGLKQSNYSKACDQVAPNVQKQCATLMPQTDIKLSNVKVGRQVISGDRALVATTGKVCQSDTCHTFTGSNSGLPDDSTTFDQAFTKASSSEDADAVSAIAMVKTKGRWYVQLS